MSDTEAKASSESEQAKEHLASSHEVTSEPAASSEASGDVTELNLGADFELDEDDLAMLFALGLC